MQPAGALSPQFSGRETEALVCQRKNLASEIEQSWVHLTSLFSRWDCVTSDKCHVTFLPQFPHLYYKVTPAPGRPYAELLPG